MSIIEYVPVDRPVANPYPDSAAEIVGFRFDTGLHLMRPRNAARLYKDGEDAAYVLSRDYRISYQLAGEGDFRSVTVPAGMLTDLASVPRLFRAFVGRVGPHLEPAIVHDYLYIAWQSVEGRGAREEDRDFADRLMRAGMKEAGVHPFHQWGIYQGVSRGGAKVYAQADAVRFVDMTDPEFLA